MTPTYEHFYKTHNLCLLLVATCLKLFQLLFHQVVNMASFEELAGQIQEVVERVYWVFVTTCTVQDYKARNYCLDRFSKDFLERAKACHGAALTKVKLDAKDVFTREFEQWLSGRVSYNKKSKTPLENASFVTLLNSILASHNNEEQVLCQKTFDELFAKQVPCETDIPESFLQQCQELLLSTTRSYLEKMLRGYENEVVWANMRIAGLLVLSPDKPKWDDLVHDMPRTIIKMATTTTCQFKTSEPKALTCFDE